MKNRLSFLAAVALLSLSVSAQQRHVTQTEVDSITRDAILIDMHDDVSSLTVKGYDIGVPNKEGQTDLPRMRGYLGAEFFTAYVGPQYVKGNLSARRALEMIDTIKTDIIGAHPDDFVFATTADDIVRAHDEHKIAALIGIEGGHAIEDSLRLLRDYYDLGVRYMTLTHVNTNKWADSQGDITNSRITHHNGLTPFGKDVVREMNRLGMMVDVSHVSDKTFWDALATSTAPVIASHSDCRAVTGATRNLTDEMIKALAAKGGVMGINFNCGFLSDRYREANRALELDPSVRAKQEAAKKITDITARVAAEDKIDAEISSRVPTATLADLVAHIDHAVKIAGIDHVGIGTDFDGVSCVPIMVGGYNEFPVLTRALLEKGYSAEDIKKIYGGNTLRVMREVEQRARELKSTHPIHARIQ